MNKPVVTPEIKGFRDVTIKKHFFNFITGKDLLLSKIAPINWLVNDIVMKGGMTYIAGKPSSFKTGFAMYLAICGATGNKVLNFETKPFKTLFIDEENGIISTKHRFKQMVEGMGLDADDIGDRVSFATISGFKLNDGWLLTPNYLENIIVEIKPDIVIIDNISRCFSGEHDENRDAPLIHNYLKPLMEVYNVSFIIIHHLRKVNNIVTSLDDIRGSGDFGGQCDNALFLGSVDADERTGMTQFLLRDLKSKFNSKSEDINFTVIPETKDDFYTPLIVNYVGTKDDALKNRAIKLHQLKKDIQEYVLEYPRNKWYESNFKELFKDKASASYIKVAIKELWENDKFFKHKIRGAYIVAKK